MAVKKRVQLYDVEYQLEIPADDVEALQVQFDDLGKDGWSLCGEVKESRPMGHIYLVFSRLVYDAV